MQRKRRESDGPSGLRLYAMSERPEPVAEKVERRHDHERRRLRDELAGPAEDQQVEHAEVRSKRYERDEEETGALSREAGAAVAERPDPIPDVVDRHGDEEGVRGSEQVVQPCMKQAVVDDEVQQIADCADRA